MAIAYFYNTKQSCFLTMRFNFFDIKYKESDSVTHNSLKYIEAH